MSKNISKKKLERRKEIEKFRETKGKLDSKRKKLLTKLSSLTLSPQSPHFISVPRTYFANILSNGYTGKGWKISFKGTNKLVFRQLESTTNDIDLEIGTNNSSYVDAGLNVLNYGQLSDIFDNSYVDLFHFDNWNDADGTNDRFFFLDKAQFESIDSDCDKIYLSQSIINYSSSSVFDFSNMYQDFALGIFPTIKLEGKDENLSNRFPIGPYPVQTRVIFTLPCPPRWSPGFGGLGH